MIPGIDFTCFGMKLQEIRSSLHLTRIEVAVHTGLSKDTIYKIEKGMVIPKYDTLEILGYLYKEDLLTLLTFYRESRHVYEFNQKIDGLIYNNDVEALSRIKKQFDTLKMEMDTNSIQLIHGLIEQYEMFITGIETLNCQKTSESLGYFLKALSIDRPTFRFESWRQFKYSLFEIRIILMLGIVESMLSEYELSNEMIRFCLKTLNNIAHKDTEKFLILKCYYNLSYNYHCLNEHRKALFFSDKGIAFCQTHYLSYALPHLLYRKGIAQFLIGNKRYLTSLNMSIQLLKITGHTTLAETFIRVTYDKYKIKLS
ncbi:helix-turn-helix domain-containing protein [Fusibacter ferrireducens]|uniref:Helix-turn-helix transcriptional regulator n=1 Tax=Fusibacter ferrireducens TaxID=2785058 RepID=A0ABR9ZRM9_9FIRM|nr:helix-turn-helix transcriptional regulator [Fusibacter ferrireducens]MBF4693099.1 helix-turn-helix transcriptional regulator [Fusibacter ferrireducens]